MRARIATRVNHFLEHYLPEQRLFLRSDTDTRFIRLKSGTQFLALAGSAVIIGWSIIATAILLMDSIGAGTVREQARRDLANYEMRLNQISAERDARAAEAQAAQERFSAALDQVSVMQSELLISEDRRRELETGIRVIQGTLRRTMQERDAANETGEALLAQLEGQAEAEGVGDSPLEQAADTVSFLTTALETTAAERDQMQAEAALAIEMAQQMELELDLVLDRNDKIFTQLEEALTVSVAPLDKMFRSAGLPPDQLLETVKRGYSGQGGPLMPLTVSTKAREPSPDEMRANTILKGLDRMNLYRIAAEKAPFDMPVKSAFRFTSGFGMRWGRMHSGTDFAGSSGTPIYATADGVVTHADWQSGYGRLIKIQHEFGIETRYAHLSKIRVKKGQRVSKGTRIGDMGNSGRSTGTHLHYEVRVGGKAVNPMNFIKAGRDVF